MRLCGDSGRCRWGAFLFLASVTVLDAQTTAGSSTDASQGLPYSLHGSLKNPAVAGINGKASYEGGSMDSEVGHNFQASITVPVARQFGLQADALYSHIADGDFFGGAGHMFWRDPTVGFIGISGGGLHRSGVDSFQAGAEGGYYLGRFTLGFFAGVGSIDYGSSVPFIDTNPTRFIGRISADWYALEDLRVGVSYTTAFDNNLFKGDLEYQTPINGLALTAEVAGGDNDYDHWLLGLRYYFGAKKSLRDRHRQDDPPGLMPQILHGLGLYGAEVRHAGAAYFAPHPDLGKMGDWGYTGMEVSRERNKDQTGGGGLPPFPSNPPGSTTPGR